MTATPRWEHNCPNCKFMGRHELFDLYFCPGHHNSPWRSNNTGPRLVSNHQGSLGSITLDQQDIYGGAYVTHLLILALKAKYITKEKADDILQGAQ